MDAFQCPDGASACAEDWHRSPSQQRNKQTWPPLPCSRSTHRGGLPPAASPTSCCADRCSVLCAGSSSSLIRAWRRGAWELCVEERSNGVSSRVQNARDPSPVARGRRKGPSEPAAIHHVNPYRTTAIQRQKVAQRVDGISFTVHPRDVNEIPSRRGSGRPVPWTAATPS